MRILRALAQPVETPDLCYIHNLVTASCLSFLRDLYPTARVVLYFEVDARSKIDIGDVITGQDIMTAPFQATVAIPKFDLASLAEYEQKLRGVQGTLAARVTMAGTPDQADRPGPHRDHGRQGRRRGLRAG